MSVAIWMAVVLLSQEVSDADEPGLLGDAAGIRPTLLDHGVTPSLAASAEVFSNVRGGIDTGTRAQGLLDLVFDADLEKSLGWTGATARLNPLWVEGQGLSRDHTGELTRVSNIDARDELRVFEAWLQPSAFDGAVSLRGGLLAADQEFLTSTVASLFLNGTFGMPILVSANVPVPVYPVGAAGVRLRVDPAGGFYVQGAAYDGHPGAEHVNTTGLRVRLEGDEGILSMVESGWSDAAGAAVKAGGFYHSENDAYGIYGAAEMPLYREALAAFVRLGSAPEHRSVVDFTIDLGLSGSGLIPGRPEDVLGLAAAFARVSGDIAGADREIVIEATYKIALHPGFSLQPDYQFLIHPGGTPAVENAHVLGVRVDLVF